MKVWSRVLIVGAVIVTMSAHQTLAQTAAIDQKAIHGEISRVADTAHLEFSGVKNWNYEVRHVDKNQIVLTMPPFDSATMARLAAFSDPYIQSITVDKAGEDGTFQVTFHLAGADIDSFDYQTDDPSRLILDFYRKQPEAKPVAKNQNSKNQNSKNQNSKKPLKMAKAHTDDTGRRPAGDEFLQVADTGSASSTPSEADDDGDGSKVPNTPIEQRSGAYDAADGNFDRFRVKDYEIREDAILASAQNIYLQFPMLKMPVSRLDDMIKNQPEYVIHAKPDMENKEAQLILVLFQRGRYNVCLKTYEHFIKKYPDSAYSEILQNIYATIHLLNWKESGEQMEYELARDAYLGLIKKYPDSTLIERNYLLLGFLQLERGEALATLEHFKSFIDKFPKSPDVPQARKAIAEAFLKLDKYDDGLSEYSSIANDYAKTPDGPESLYRKGDVEFARSNWPGAVQTYQSVLKDLPQYSKTFPNAHFNMAEALFWKKDYKQSLNEFISFLNLFPTHPYGGYAMTRIGEIMEILGVDPRRSMGAFLESSFRYPDNPGAKVARLRMLTAQMRNMRPKDLKKALDEIRGAVNEVHLPGMEEFSTLLLAKGLLGRGDYTESLQSLIDYYRDHPSLKNKEQFNDGILRGIASEIKTDLDHGKFVDALKFHSKYDKTWLHGSQRIDIPYFEGLAFEQAGSAAEAEKIYDQVNDALVKMAGTQEEKQRRVAEFLPKRSSLQLRLAAVAVDQRHFAEAYQHLKQLAKIDELSEPEQVERVQLLASIAEYRGEYDRAADGLRDLIKRWKGEPNLLNPAVVHLADLELRANSFEAAQNYADRALANKDLPDDLQARALEVKGDSLLGQKRPMAALEIYQNLLEKFEAQRPLGNIRYKVGQILFSHGDLKGAEEVWNKLQSGPGEIYWDLAKEKLANAKWSDEYKKYANRIPAMSSTSHAGESKQ